MNTQRDFEINLEETFPNLPAAPIVEAVIHWRARAEKQIQLFDLQEKLKERLPDYPELGPQRKLEIETQIGTDGPSIQTHDEWLGIWLKSVDSRYIAQFSLDGLVFSRLTPYENWDLFEAEALRLWNLYDEILEPSEIQRLGVRFINRIAPIEMDKLDQILTIPPKCPETLDLPVREFLHQSRYDIPGSPYNLNVTQTVQPPIQPQNEEFGVILDIDVFTTEVMPKGEESLRVRLTELRWLKNKAFFTFLTKGAINACKESTP